jgi:hypothetical protein
MSEKCKWSANVCRMLFPVTVTCLSEDLKCFLQARTTVWQQLLRVASSDQHGRPQHAWAAQQGDPTRLLLVNFVSKSFRAAYVTCCHGLPLLLLPLC